MAAVDDLRRLTNEPEGDSRYNDDVLESALLAANGNMAKAVAEVWRWKAARFAELVDMQEGDSRRDLSDMYSNALRMAELYDGKAGDGTVDRPTTIGRITRA